MTSTLLLRLDARDRALLTRWAIDDTAPRAVRLFWLTVTRLGGVVCSVLAALLPLVMDGLLERVAIDALTTLVVSHLAVQLVKRTVSRPRPSRVSSRAALIEDPDRFSFPSGHSAAAMSVAFAYAVAYPALAAPIVLVAMIVGLSRVALGVHYPGDVLVGQLLALGTGLVVVAF
jgi:undecaprenyl-diphosphatase